MAADLENQTEAQTWESPENKDASPEERKAKAGVLGNGLDGDGESDKSEYPEEDDEDAEESQEDGESCWHWISYPGN